MSTVGRYGCTRRQWIYISKKVKSLFSYSPIRNRNISIDNYLSGISRNSTKHIVGASVARMTYFQKFDVVLDKSSGTWVSGIHFKLFFQSIRFLLVGKRSINFSFRRIFFDQVIWSVNYFGPRLYGRGAFCLHNWQRTWFSKCHVLSPFD